MLIVSGQVKRPDRMFDKEGKPLGMRHSECKKSTLSRSSNRSPNTRLRFLSQTIFATIWRKQPILRFMAGLVQFGLISPWMCKLRKLSQQVSAVLTLENWKAKGEVSNLKLEAGQLIEKLNTSERPLLFAGNGIRLAHAEKEFEELRHLLRVPTVADLVCGRPGSE